jgi:hypothetical protein
MSKSLDFSDLGATPVAAAPLDFSDLGAEKVGHDDISKMESFGRGVQQGATLGTGDEFSGLVEGGADTTQMLLNKLGLADPSPTQVNEDLAKQGVNGDLGPQSFMDMYRQGRDSNRAENAAAEQANPMSFIGGNVAGGVLPGIVAPQVLMNPLGSAAKTAPIAQKVIQGAINAAPLGALAGGTLSNTEMTYDKATPDDALNFGKDVLSGAGSAAAFGGAVPLVTEPIKAGASAIKNSKMGKDVSEAWKAGLDKIDLTLPDTLKNYRDMIMQKAGTVDSSIRKADKGVLDERKVVLEGLDPKQTTNVRKTMQDFADAVNSGVMLPDEATMINTELKKIMSGSWDKSPKELDATLKQINGILANSKAGGTTYSAAKDAQKALRASQDTLDPRLQGLNQKAGQITELGESLTKNNPLEFTGGAQDSKIDEMLANILERPKSDYRTQSYLDKVVNRGLETGSGTKVPPLSQLVPEAADAITSAQPLAERLDLAKRMQNVSTKIGGTGGMERVGNAVMTAGPKIANVTGQVVQENKEFLQRGIKGLSDASPEQLKQLSGKMVEVGGKAGQEFARVLAGAEGKNNVSKSAIMFGLMQKPEFRSLFHQVNGDAENVEPGQ